MPRGSPPPLLEDADLILDKIAASVPQAKAAAAQVSSAMNQVAAPTPAPAPIVQPVVEPLPYQAPTPLPTPIPTPAPSPEPVSQIAGQLEQISDGLPPEHWLKSYWRPAMGWLYMVICFMDFTVFPLLSMFLPIIEKGFGMQVPYVAWQSLTLSNGGLIHLSFGAILGVSAWTRGTEKVAKVNTP